jgi:hypothetical protein
MNWKSQYLTELKSDISNLLNRSQAGVLINYMLKKELNMIKDRLDLFITKINKEEREEGIAKQESLV